MRTGFFGTWTDAEAALPTETDEYIVHIEGAGTTATLWWNNKKKIFFEEMDDGTILTYKVTHWMPMPAPPPSKPFRASLFDIWKDEAVERPNKDFNLV